MFISELFPNELEEGSISDLPTGWDKNNKHQGKRIKMSYDQVHKIMTTDEYLRDRGTLGPHEFDPQLDGEQGTVGVRLTKHQVD